MFSEAFSEEGRGRPSSLVVNTATRHLLVTGSIPIWVTTPQRRERWGSGFNSRKSPRLGLVSPQLSFVRLRSRPK